MRNDVYEKTTHSVESLDTTEEIKSWPLRCFSRGSRVKQDEQELERFNSPQDSYGSQANREAGPSGSADYTVVIRPGTSAADDDDDDEGIGQPLPKKTPLTERMMTFFGLYDESQEEWERRRKRHIRRIGRSKHKDDKGTSDQPTDAASKKIEPTTPEERVPLSPSGQDVDIFDRPVTSEKILAKKKEDGETTDGVDGEDYDGVDEVDHAIPSIVISLFGIEEKSQEDDGSVYYRKALRDNAPKVLWKAASRSLSAKPSRDVPTVFSYRGRSFTPADQENVQVTKDELRKMIVHRHPPRPFFKAFGCETYTIDQLSEITDSDRGLEKAGHGESLDLSQLGKPLRKPGYAEAMGFDEVDQGRKPEYDETYGHDQVDQGRQDFDESAGFDEVDNSCTRQRNRSFCEATTPVPLPSKMPLRRTKSQIHNLGRGPIKNLHEKKKKEKLFDVIFGDSFIGEYMRRKSKSKEEKFDFRPYFTYWVSFVQVVILFVMVSTHSFAPIGFSQKTIEEKVLISRDGALQFEQLPHTTVQSFWIGPSLNTLIMLGAKYAPCMRHDTKLFKVLDEERLQENSTGCCLQTFNTGCIQRQQTECSTSFTVFKAKTVCGQDPTACLDPKSTPPNEWDKNTIINWPVCYKNRNKSELLDLPHMQCEVTGRPCCIGTQAQCIITSQDYCKFKGGVYHNDKTLCSQVDCLESTCGLIPFAKKDQPNQFYRLYLSLFLNAGVLHVIIVLIFNFLILKDIEKMVGWLRTAFIYLFSGIGGNLWSAVLIPYEPEVGPSGAAFGILACLFVELYRYRSDFETPYIYILKLFVFIFILFLFGLLPYIDNYAHIFGFIYGIFLGLIFLPYPNEKKDENPSVNRVDPIAEVQNPVVERRSPEVENGIPQEESGSLNRKINLLRLRDILLSLIFLVGLTVLGFLLFYVVQDADTSGVEYFNCIEITENFCNNFHQGKHLEKRETTY